MGTSRAKTPGDAHASDETHGPESEQTLPVLVSMGPTGATLQGEQTAPLMRVLALLCVGLRPL